ncbi:ABC transporter substrate-binding protein [Chloroflexota bacterium]
MKKRIIWLVLSCFMVAILVLSSCTTTPTPKPTPAPGPEVPKYGGTFTGVLDPPDAGFDDFNAGTSKTFILQNTNEDLQMGDWAKGPAGTDETNFWISDYQYAFQTGCLAESWELPDADTVIFHIRKGVHWHDKPPVNGRELTAEDVAFSLTRVLATPGSVSHKNYGKVWFVSAEATDKYTVVVKGHDTAAMRTGRLWNNLTNGIAIVPPEVVEKYGDMRDWKNSLGTGPFMLTDFTPASSATMVRNPNYWGKDPLHPENQLPYLDSVIWMDIRDKSTQLSALRTGKVDRVMTIGWEDGESLIETNPELQFKKELTARVLGMWWRVDKPELPFADLKVRRALQMAIDRQAIADSFYGGNAMILSTPVAPFFKNIYTPLEELPESIRELYEYHPEKAKELLTEAGYPDGFKTSIVTPSDAMYVDMLSIVKDYWSKIGVDLELKTHDYSVFKSMQMGKSHEEMIVYTQTLGSPYTQLYVYPEESPYNLSYVNDPYISEQQSQIWAFENMKDEAKQNELLKESVLQQLEQAYIITPPCPYVYTMWQPWVQNYHGEFSVGYASRFNFPKWIWLDQDLK